jgi:hypothetical protein
LNAIWQADACDMSLQTLAHASVPPNIFNVAGPEMLRVRDVAAEFGRRFNQTAHFEGEESADALLSNGQKAYQFFGRPRVSAEQMMVWIADWVSRGGDTLAKPTHFEDRSGRF